MLKVSLIGLILSASIQSAVAQDYLQPPQRPPIGFHHWAKHSSGYDEAFLINWLDGLHFSRGYRLFAEDYNLQSCCKAYITQPFASPYLLQIHKKDAGYNVTVSKADKESWNTLISSVSKRFEEVQEPIGLNDGTATLDQVAEYIADFTRQDVIIQTDLDKITSTQCSKEINLRFGTNLQNLWFEFTVNSRQLATQDGTITLDGVSYNFEARVRVDQTGRTKDLNARPHTYYGYAHSPRKNTLSERFVSLVETVSAYCWSTESANTSKLEQDSLALLKDTRKSYQNK